MIEIRVKKILALLLTMCMMLGMVTYMPELGVQKAYAADTGSTSYMRFETNYSQKGLDGSFGSYRIWGTVDGYEKQTTFANEGWRITLINSGGNTASVGQIGNGSEKIVSLSGVNYGITQNLSIVNNGRYVKVEFAVRNTSTSSQIFSIGSGADVQIGNNDSAPITQFADGSGFYMADGVGAQFNFIGKNAYGVTNVDTFWYGNYGSVNANMFNQAAGTSLTGTDSGMAFAWNNRSIAAGTTNRYSILIGIGALNAPPTTILTGTFAPGGSLPDVLPSGTYTVSGTVSDTENTTGTELYYAIDERLPVKFYTFSGTPGSFSGTINIPNDITPGTHMVSVYAQDRDGAISSATQKNFTVLSGLTLTGHDLSYTAGQGSVFLDPSFTVDYSGTVNSGKVYIESDFNSATDSLSFTNGNGITGSYNAANGVLSLSGATTAANYQAFIRNIKFNSTAGSGSRTVVVTLATGSGSVFYYSGNGHYYEYVASNGVRWTNAKTAAGARTYQGLTGYLATITSAEENSFVAAKCAGDGWLGGTDEGHDKEWYWVTGPEAGNKFCQQKPYTSGGNGVLSTVAGWYQNFAIGEPNDYPSGQANGENYLHMYSADGTWNDYAENSASIKGYLVEYGTTNQPAAGSVSVINVIFTDSTAPTINNISGNPSSWTSGNVTLTVSAFDAGTGLHSGGAYSFNNGAWTTSNSQTFTSNQTVNVRVRDNSGNIVSQDVIINKIDKNAPTFTNITQSPTAWTSESVTLTVNGLTDNSEAGLHAMPYSFSTTAGVYNWQASSVSTNFSNNRTVYVYVRDALGNISTASAIPISNIDTTMPNAPVIGSAASYTTSNWYNTNKTVTASFTPTTGCSEKLQYQIDSGAWTDGSSANITGAGTYSLKFRVIDELGRTSSVQSCTVQIDKSNPTVTASDTDYSWRNSNFLVPIQFNDLGGSGIDTMQYALTGSTALPGSWTNATVSQNVSVVNEGSWYVHYKVTDTAGNSQTGYYGPYKLDKTNPAGSVSINSDKINNGIAFIRDRVATASLTSVDALSGSSDMRFSDSLANISAATWVPAAATHSYTFASGDGLKTVFYQVKDSAGNVSPVYSDFIYLDTTKPTLSISAPTQYVAKRGDVIKYTVTFDDNSKTFGDSTIAANNGIDNITLSVSDVVLSQFGSIDISDITVSVEPVSAQPLKRLIKLTLPSDMQGEGSVNLKIAANTAEDKSGNLSAETLCGYSFSIDNVVPSNQNQLFSENLKVKGGSAITLNGSSVDFDGHEADSVRFAPATFNGEPADIITITSTNGTSSHINAPLTEGEYYLFIIDSAGNISRSSTAKLTVDNTGPAVSISAPDKTIVKDDAQIDYTVSFSADTVLSSIDSLFTKSKIGLNTTGVANAIINIIDVPGNPRQKIVRLSDFSGDGVINGITIAADICRDDVGNGSVSVTQATELLIDCTKPLQPTIIFTKTNDGVISRIINFVTFGYFYNEEIKVTLHSGDINGSGLSKIYYKTDEASEYAEKTPNAQDDVILTLPVGFKGNVFAYAVDTAGNTSSPVKSDGVISENSAPVINVTPIDASAWFAANQTLTVNVTDNEGLKEVKYSVDGVVTIVDMVGSYTDKQCEYNFTIPLTTDSTGHIIQINATDLAGNVANTYNASIKLDKTLPQINSVTGNPTDWSENDVTLAVSANDATSGLAEQAYSFDDGATWQAQNTKTYTQNTADIKIKVKDTAGNIQSYEPISIIKIDKTVPEDAIIATPENYGVDVWYNTTQTIMATFTQTSGCSEKLQYKINSRDWTDGTSVSVTDEGVYSVKFRVIDYLGRTSAEQTALVNLDKNAPTGLKAQYGTDSFKEFLNTITFGLFFKDTVTITLSADDATSGVKQFTFTIAGKDAQTITASNGKACFTIEPQFKGNFSVSVKDNAGNSTEPQAYEYLAADKNAPTAPVIASGTYTPGTWTADDVALTVSEANALSGIAKYQFTVTSDEALSGSEIWTDISSANGTVVKTDATETTPLNVTSSSVTVSDTCNVYYHLRAVSNSGITGEVKTVSVKIDKVTPVITINTNGYDGTWTKNNVCFDLSNGTSNISGISYYYSTDNGTSWYPVSNEIYHEITSDTNAAYQFKAVSGAKLKSLSGMYTIQIQKTVPQNAAVAISPETATGDNGWYKNINGTRPTITITSPSITNTAPVTTKYKLWSGEEPSVATVFNGTQPTIGSDGIWNLKVWTEDAAGNKSGEFVRTVKVDTSAPTGTIKVKDNSFKQFINTVTFGLFFKQNVDVSITADSDLSDIAKIEHYKSASELSQSQLEALKSNDWTQAGTFSITPNDKLIVYARITDKAGNVSVINSQGVVVYTDSNITSNSAFFDTDTTRNGYRDVTVNLELNGNALKSVKLGSVTLEKDTDYAIDGNTVTLKKEYLKSAVNGTVTFTFSFNPMGEKFEDGVSIGDAPNTKTITVIQLVHAKSPIFDLNLSGSKIYTKGDTATALNVEATVTDNGTVSYQWYVNGTAIIGATDKSYAPNTDKTGVYDYYVIATNTDKSVNGDQTITAQSGTYRVVVNNAAVNEPDIADNAPKTTIKEDSQAILESALTAEDQSKLDNGYDISVNLKVEEIANATPDEKNAVFQIIGDNTFGQYMDISLMKTLIDAEGYKSEQKITQLKTPLTITIDIPKDLLPKDGVARTFSIIRVHNGVAEELKDLDNVLNTITIQTDCFSTYAIVYKDPASTDKKPSDIPDTGDTTPVIPYAMLAATSLFLVIQFHRKRRNKAEGK